MLETVTVDSLTVETVTVHGKTDPVFQHGCSFYLCTMRQSSTLYLIFWQHELC